MDPEIDLLDIEEQGEMLRRMEEEAFADQDDFFGEAIQEVAEPTVAEIPSSETEIKVENVQHSWTVKNFSHCFDELLENFVYLRRGEKQLVWSIKIYPKGNGRNNRDFVFFCLNRVIKPDEPVTKVGTKARFTLKNANKLPIEIRHHPNPTHSEFVFYCKREVIYPQIMPQDSFTLHVSIDVAVDTVTTMSGPALFPLANPSSEMADAYQRMFQEGLMSDFTIIVENRRIAAHRGVLAVRSPVFRAMLEHKETKEATTGELIIKDFEYDVIHEMVRFMYCGRCRTDLGGMTPNLFIAADMYRIDELKLHCEKILAEGLTVENACMFFVMADFHTAPRLRQNAIRFIIQNSKQVTNSSGWKDLMKDHTHLVTEIVSQFNEHQHKTGSTSNISELLHAPQPSSDV